MRTRKFSELEARMSPESRKVAKDWADAQVAAIVRPCWVCKGRQARWAVFHDHEQFMSFDPVTSVYVAACDECLVTAQRQDPQARNYIRPLNLEHICPSPIEAIEKFVERVIGRAHRDLDMKEGRASQIIWGAIDAELAEMRTKDDK